VCLADRGGRGDRLYQQRLAIGCERHDAGPVNLYLVESFTFRVLTAEAAVALAP
jgi:uncharacterized linocin/CFP29 family protein